MGAYMSSAMDYLQWIWVFLALLCFFVEVFAPGKRFLLLGIGAAVAALLAFLGITVVWQVVAFAVVAAIGILAAQFTTRRATGSAETVYGIDRVIGKEAIVIVAIDPKTAQGRVRVERDQWPADSESGQPIADGATVQVLAVRGERVLVRPLPNARQR